MTEEDYERFKIKEFDAWDLFLHINQYPYIGRCYASAKRKEADLVTDMTNSERNELFEIIVPKWHKSVKKLFDCDRPNIVCLGNTWNHLHWHLIPRYNEEKEFYGIKFLDSNPNGNYSPYSKQKIEENILMQIKEEIEKLI